MINPLKITVQGLNTPFIKEGVKNIAGSVTLIFGLAEVYLFLQNFKKTNNNAPEENKAIIACTRISLILSAAVSRPGVLLISALVGRVCSSQTLEKAFGPNTIFAVNPRHPRHVASFAAVILAAPSLFQLFYKHSRNCSWEKCAIVFNTITSRPTLHVGNQMGRYVLRALF
ncbi:MAG: hypothetical protein KBA81_00530 [Rhabdochlamydiaceae bacterium]|nr:hypothetical protein [Rhabdochlamydiaceae bacterium]